MCNTTGPRPNPAKVLPCAKSVVQAVVRPRPAPFENDETGDEAGTLYGGQALGADEPGNPKREEAPYAHPLRGMVFGHRKPLQMRHI